MTKTTNATAASKKNRRSAEHYFAAVSRESLMTQEEEREIAIKYRETGAQVYADKLVKANVRFVIKIALEYRHYGFPLLDLIQEGNVGLLRAIRTYDPDKRYRLISYAVWWIRAFIQEYILRNWSLVKIGTTQLQRRLFNHLQSSRKRMRLMQVSADPEERRRILARQIGGTVKDVEEMEMRFYSKPVSFDAPLFSDREEDHTLHERFASNSDSSEQLLEEKQVEEKRRQEVQRALAQLPDRERKIVVSRHLRTKPVTLRELAKSLGISKERVRQLEVRALRTLRDIVMQQPEYECLLPGV